MLPQKADKDIALSLPHGLNVCGSDEARCAPNPRERARGRMKNRILIIDDDEMQLANFKRWARRELQCEVHCATDREEAEALLDCHEYALVITDLSLSPERLEGLDLVDRIANAPLRPKLIALTGNESPQVKNTALRKGVDAFLEKPVPIQVVIETVRNLINSAPVSHATPAPSPFGGRVLAQVLADAAIQSYVQPIFLFGGDSSPRLVGVECLSRGPVGTLFEPADALFAYARRKRVEAQLDQNCISLALSEMANTPSEIRISLNVHASTLSNRPEFAEWLCADAAVHAIPPERLTIEVVEHAPEWNKKELLRALDSLRSAGVKIALDDIGLGHSNYQMIVDVRPHYFKIDRYFVQGCSENPYLRAVICSIATLAREFNGVVVAEGPETPADFKVLEDLGINLAQSFALGRPVPTKSFKQTQLPGCRLMGTSGNEDAAIPGKILTPEHSNDRLSQ